MVGGHNVPRGFSTLAASEQPRSRDNEIRLRGERSKQQANGMEEQKTEMSSDLN
jgi:hypothetical protein